MTEQEMYERYLLEQFRADPDTDWAEDSPNAPDYVRPKGEDRSPTEVFIGALETLATIASGATTGMIGGAVGAVDGILGSALNGYEGRQFGENARARSEQLAAEGTYMPRTEAGMEYLQNVSEPISAGGAAPVCRPSPQA